MNIKFVKWKRLFLCGISVFVSFALCSCGVLSLSKPADNSGDTTADAVTTEPYELNVWEGNYSSAVDRFLGDLSGNEYEGQSFKVVSAKKDLVVADENTSKVLSREVIERNEAVMEKIGVAIVCEERDANTMLGELKASVKAGDYYADAVIYPQNMIAAFVMGDAVINMKSLPGFETDGGYFYKTAVAAGTGGDAVYAVTGPGTFNPDSLSCIYFNKTLVEKAGLESPYALVDRGEWTIDKYIEYANAAASLEGEYYGYGAQNTQPYINDLFFFAAGERFTDSAVGSYPTLILGGERTLAVIEKIKGATLGVESSGNALGAIDSFSSGNTLFLVERLFIMKDLANSATSWGVLPLPKYDAAQTEYYSLGAYEDAMFMSAVATSADYAMTADAIACINIMSYGYTMDAYVTNATYYYLRDNDSIRMLDTVVKNPVFDFAYSFANSYDSIPSATFSAVRNTVAGVSSLERYLGMWTGQFNTSMYRLFDVEQ